MKLNMVLLTGVLLFSLLAVQGASSEWQTENTYRTNYAQITATSVYTSSKYIDSLSVYGDTIAWTERFTRSDGNTDLDVMVYSSGEINQYGLPGWEDIHPAVGDTVIWTQTPLGSGDAKIVTPSGIVFSQQGVSGLYPAIDGSNIAFDAMTSSGEKVGYVIGGHVGFITPNTTFSVVDISSEYIVYGKEIYCISNGTQWHPISYATLYRISGDWVLYAGRSNFGKSVYMGVFNVKTGENHVIVSYNTGLYGRIDSFDFDGSLVVWSYEGSGYIYNIYSQETQNIPSSSVISIAIGGGTIAWVSKSGNTYSIWEAEAPKIGGFVDAKLYDSAANQPDTEAHILLVMDSQGHRFGGWNSATSDIYREIPGAILVQRGTITEYRIPTSDPNQLHYKVIGGHDGKYSLYIHGLAPTRAMQWAWVNATAIPIKKDAVHTYTVDWEKVISGAKNSVNINIDTNGDGNVDRTLIAGSTIDASTFKSKSSGENSDGIEISLNSGGCLVVGIIAMVIIGGIVVVLKKRK